jgi:VWFA-related protein
MSWRRALIAAALPALLILPAPAEEQRRQLTIEPIEIDMTEQTERRLLLLDVEALDKDGNPMTGLVKEDFRIRVNYLWRQLYSVDDLCACGDAAPDPDNPPADPVEKQRLALIRSAPHYVLYFDYSQLAERGRKQAREEASRWARDVMQPEDRVMVAAYATEGGLRTYTDFTEDRGAVLAAIEKSFEAPEMNDPFPGDYDGRTQMCIDGTLNCSHTGRQEYFHARRSMETLRNFLTDLDEVPERKTLILFHENATIFPGRLYGGASSDYPSSIMGEVRGYATPQEERIARMRNATGWVPDLLELEEQLGGAATASRTAVYPIVCGTARAWSVNLGANLADQTGGEYNRSIDEVGAVIDEAGRRCPCYYRLGLEMREKDDSLVLRTKIRVKDEVLPSRYRVEYLTKGDRWMRKAQLVMANPDAWNELGVRAAIVPVAASKKTWDLAVQVAVDISGMEAEPTGEHGGEWEVAALLGNENFRKSWEMLGVYRVEDDERRERTVVLHERRFEGLKPGRYELRSFARDRETNRYGAARTSIELPSPAEGGLTSPVMLRPAGWHFASRLPMKKDRRPPAAEAKPPQRGLLPAGDEPALASGESLHLVSWYCGASPSSVRAVVRDDDGSEREQELAEGERRGNCRELTTTVESEGLAAGSYVYELTAGAGEPSARPFDVR